jgi:hypothetical protein
MDKKRKAIALLRKHDALEAQLRILKRETAKAVADYGVTSLRSWGLSMDKFRIQLQMEAERKAKEKNRA